ncbi:hypothetical protein EDB19DRAFT_2041132 [Suillus lakei]|nr:hypothetical protein EDB19DRAFT_2041132 [Suillus lakei]
MMDPISAIASGLTVLQLLQTIAQASALLYGYVASVRDADSSCQSLLNEFSSIGGVLTTVTEVEKDTSLPDTLRRALSILMAKDGPVANLLMELKNILPNEQERGKMGVKDKLKWPFKGPKASAIVAKLKDYYREIASILAIDTWNTTQGISQGVQQVGRTLQKVDLGVEELQKTSAAQKMHEKAEEREKFLQWMSPVSCTDRHEASRRQHNPESGRWIFHNDEYVAWNESDSAFLWLNGQPGHGKTVLASSVIDEIQGSGEAEPRTLAYFYCNFRDDRTTIAAAVLRSLVVQLLRESKDDWVTKIRESGPQEEVHLVSLRKLWKQKSKGESCPTDLGFLRMLLVEASELVHLPVLVIDALDECKDYPELVRHLVKLLEDAWLRLFVTSRSEQAIQYAFHGLPTVSLKDSAGQVKADIHAHITEQLKTQKQLSRLPDALKRTILEKLLEKAEGMFRWVQCQLDVIMKCKRLDSIRKALDNLPEGLYETYDRIIRSIEERGPDDGPIARSCLLWLAGAFTPLTLDQLNEAIMIEVGRPSLNEDLGVTDTMDIVAACGSLVTYNKKTGIVVLSHYSVKEYLISDRPNNILKSISNIHARICELLITYVLCDFVDEICEKDKHPALQHYPWQRHAHVSKEYPLMSYAIQGWKHLGHVSDEDPCIMVALSRLNSEFLQNTKKHRVLAIPSTYSWGEPGWLSAAVTFPSLFIPLVHGKPWMVEFVAKQQPHLLDVDIAPGWGSPLIFAIAKNPDYLSILLKLGVDLNKLSSVNPHLYGRGHIRDGSYAPISWAAVIRSEVAMDFLLLQQEVILPNNILHMAVRVWHLSHESIRKFRQRGADVNFTIDGSTPIHTFLFQSILLARSSSLPVVQALVEPSCNLSLQNWTGRTVLHIALDGRLEDIITYLLEQNAGLSGTATLHPDMWSWATNKTWFPQVQAAALAADKPWTRIKGKVIDATTKSQRVEFSVAVTADHDNANPICAVVVSAIVNGEVTSYMAIPADVSYGNQSSQKEIQDFPTDDSPKLSLTFSWEVGQRVSSCLFNYHQGDKVTTMLRHMSEDRDLAGTSIFLQMTERGYKGFHVLDLGVECVLDIYRGPLD